MSDKSSGSSGGVGFFGLLQIVFIVLKLCHVIEWSWLWVLAPTWIGLITGVIGLAIAFLLAAIFGGD